ncbi:hypothetical protein FH972_014362 [Carpinus fangiana]|uniref:Putative plant transposon protein domain-containing protein n=1 Tax=Carpinus fangiana TaxID=176857 RepID=A0A5N6L0L1_9ROSI|nr:hypothetical protein FH972_025283 [Carpinus fangiana]KAE8056505.1 hypothetical protein FH972_013274 [Carpinus fangiana]KAE8075668.1 hypothetical protein FH972_014362 [Carpinus fangiana]
MDSERHSSRKLPIRSKSKTQKRKAADEGSVLAVDQVQTTRLEIGFRFRNKSTKKIFQERFHDRTVIAARPVNLSDLQDSNFQMISQIFTQRKWEYFIAPPARPFINLVREFYANMDSQQISDYSIDAPLQILSFIRGVPIVVTREVIAEVTGISLIEEPGYPYPTEEFPSKFDMSKLFIPPDSYNHWQDYMMVIPLGHLSHPVKLLARIVMQNVFPIDHHSDLRVARGRLIYALLTDVQIDFASIAIRLMKAMFSETSISLPYGSLISRIIAKFVQIPNSEPTMKHLGPFCKATVSRSKGQMRLRGTKDFEAASDPAATTEPGPSEGASTPTSVSLEDVMAKLNVMVAQMTTFSSILATLQTDVKELKTKIVGSFGLDEDTDEEQSMSD